MTIAQISGALTRARRKTIAEKAAMVQAALRAEHLGQPEIAATAHATPVQVRDQSSALGYSGSSATTPSATPPPKPRKNYAGTSPIGTVHDEATAWPHHAENVAA